MTNIPPFSSNYECWLNYEEKACSTSAGSAGDVTDTSQQNIPNKRRGRDLGDLMVRKTAPVKLTSEKPVEQIRAPMRPEIWLRG